MPSLTATDLKSFIRDVPDFPKPGIIFRDITPLLSDSEALWDACQLMIPIDKAIDKVAAIESRGFIFGAIMASILGVGFIPIRKKGKLPPPTVGVDYKLEYGEASIEIPAGVLRDGENVLIVDDVLATGGTLAAAVKLIRNNTKANPIGCSVLFEIADLHGRKAVDIPIWTVL